MNRIPHEAQSLMRRLRQWRETTHRFARETGSCKQNDHASLAAKATRRRVLQLSREAQRRLKAKDWDWFWWLDLFGILVATERDEEFDDRYRQPLERAAAIERKRRAATVKAADARRAIGARTKQKVIAGQRPVSKRHARRLKEK
jgi:hypothetical protein